jgi:hypothetical protein
MLRSEWRTAFLSSATWKKRESRLWGLVVSFLSVLAGILAYQNDTALGGGSVSWLDKAEPAVYVFVGGLFIYFLGHLTVAPWTDAVTLKNFIEREGFLPVEDHVKLDQLRKRAGLIWYELSGEKLLRNQNVAQHHVQVLDQMIGPLAVYDQLYECAILFRDVPASMCGLKEGATPSDAEAQLVALERHWLEVKEACENLRRR